MENEVTEVAPAPATETSAAPEQSQVAQAPEAEKPKVETPNDTEQASRRAERRIQRLHSEKAYAQAEADQLRKELSKYQQQPQQERQKVEIDPEEVERTIETKARELAAERQRGERVQSVIKEGQAKFPDFDQLTAAMAEELPVYANNKPTPALEAILDCDNPAAVVAHLGKNPDLAAELNGLSVSKMARKLAQIEREMSEPAKPSSAPKPHEPEKATSSSASVPDGSDPVKWRAYWNKQEAEKRNR